MADQQHPAGRYPHVLKAFTETPWAIELPVLASIRELLVLRAAGERFSEEEIEARIGAGPAQRATTRDGSVATIPLWGVLVPRANLFTYISGGTSIQEAQSAFREALEDKDVSAIVFDVNSPGGVTDMIPEFAAEIRAARGRKPIVAVSNTKTASAALWLATQADEFVASPSAIQGSIGVFAAHEDWSRAEEMEGVKTTLISAGKYKTSGNPFEPLSQEARAVIQERVDEAYASFTADVARGRRVPVDDVRRDGSAFGEGKMLSAKQALKAGMVDRVETLEQTLARLQSEESTRTAVAFADHYVDANAEPRDSTEAPKSLTFTDEADALHDSARAFVDRLTSLAEVQRGHLTVAKRDRLAACTGAFRDVTSALAEVLDATDPDKHRKAVLLEATRYERLRLTSTGGKA